MCQTHTNKGDKFILKVLSCQRKMFGLFHWRRHAYNGHVLFTYIHLTKVFPKLKTGLGSRTPATCKSQVNQPFAILKISCKSKLYPNMAIPLFKIVFKAYRRVLIWDNIRGWRAAGLTKNKIIRYKALIFYKVSYIFYLNL